MNAYINRVVLLAPCFGYLESGASKQSTTGNELYSAGFIKNALNGIGIYASGDTTTWEADVAKICDELSSDLCAWAQGQSTDEANSLPGSPVRPHTGLRPSPMAPSYAAATSDGDQPRRRGEYSAWLVGEDTCWPAPASHGTVLRRRGIRW